VGDEELPRFKGGERIEIEVTLGERKKDEKRVIG